MDPYYVTPDDRVTVHLGDCLDVLRGMPDESVDSVVTDPPYGLEFMGRTWDRFDGEPIDPGFMHWFAGFVDGEGCFSVHKKKHPSYDCQFSITLRADDRPILERIQRTLRIGTLSKPTAHVNGVDNPKARFSVSSQRDCVRLRDLLRAFPLRAKKAIDFEVWSDALDAWLAHERGDWDDMALLRDELMQGRAYKDEGIRVDPFQMWCWRWSRECLRVLKPGGHLVAFGGTRTWHRLACAIEDAGFEVRDSLAWLYGQGFPKSLDVSKAIDKAAGAEREVVGDKLDRPGYHLSGHDSGTGAFGHGLSSTTPETRLAAALVTAPATDDAARWSGWGTALKPAYEPIVLARKPLAGTVAGNVLAHGTGALNIDGCRIGAADSFGSGAKASGGFVNGYASGDGWTPGNAAGRWPANVILDAEAAALLDEQSGIQRDGVASGKSRGFAEDGYVGGTGSDYNGPPQTYGSEGGASRFFYTAKADTGERPTVNGTRHPTVKPLDLMRWLVRLVTPPGGLVLDPFAGSGTTGEAAWLEGFGCVLVEREADYLPLIVARLTRQVDPVAHAAVTADPDGDPDLLTLLWEDQT